jgi:hypothetical protein
MDSIWVSEAYDLGSIPSKATDNFIKKSTFGEFFYEVKKDYSLTIFFAIGPCFELRIIK